MEKHQVDESSQTTTGNQSNQNLTDNQSNQNPNEKSDANKNPLNESGSKTDEQVTETPGIGDENKKQSDEITMSVGEDDDTDGNRDKEQNTEEPVEEGPLNDKQDERKIGDSDAQAIVNGTENQVVNQ